MNLTDTETTAFVAVAEAGRMDAIAFFDQFGGVVMHNLIGLNYLESIDNDVQIGQNAPGAEEAAE